MGAGPARILLARERSERAIEGRDGAQLRRNRALRGIAWREQPDRRIHGGHRSRGIRAQAARAIRLTALAARRQIHEHSESLHGRGGVSWRVIAALRFRGSAANACAMLPETILPGALKTEEEHRRDLCTAGRWLHQRGYTPSTDGNVSLRLDPRRILASPTGISKGMMEPDDLVITDLQGNKISGRRNPSSELAMHLLIYRRRPDVFAICHAHPPVATGYAA